MQQQTLSRLPPPSLRRSASVLHRSCKKRKKKTQKSVSLRDRRERLRPQTSRSKIRLRVQFLARSQWEKNKKGGFLLSLSLSLSGYQQVPSVVTLCSICAAEVSRDVYCERVNRLCCCFRGHGLRHINPPLCAGGDQVAGANGSEITRLSARRIRLIITVCFCFFFVFLNGVLKAAPL